MKKKLTLVIDDEVIDRAKRLARSRGESLSELVETYLADQTEGEDWTPPPKSVLARLTGALMTDASGRSDDDRLEQALREKYGCGSGQARVNQKPNPKPRLTPH